MGMRFPKEFDHGAQMRALMRVAAVVKSFYRRIRFARELRGLAACGCEKLCIAPHGFRPLRGLGALPYARQNAPPRSDLRSRT